MRLKVQTDEANRRSTIVVWAVEGIHLSVERIP